MGGLISRKYVHDNKDEGIVNNIICFQTPHTGSPLAKYNLLLEGAKASLIGIFNTSGASWFTGDLESDFNVATIDLLPGILGWFNSNYSDIGNTKIYSTYSAEWWNVARSGGLAITYGVILAENLVPFLTPFFPGTNDGAVPVQSAKGKIWNSSKVNMEDRYNSRYDHHSCYRHPVVLDQALLWLGLDQLVSKADLMMFATQAETSPPPTPLYLVSAFSGDLNASEEATHSVSINASTKAYFMTGVSETDGAFTLESPTGSIVDPSVALTDPNITYTVENGRITYEITSPSSGSWIAKILASASLTESIHYGITVFEDQFILLVVNTVEWTNINNPVLLTATLANNTGAITNAVVDADIVLPDSTVISTTLYDDATNGDVIADDGIYSFSFASTSLSGSYSITVNATDASSSFVRTAFTSFTAAPADIAISGLINDQGVDTNSNSYFDILRFNVPVTISVANNYRLTASLIDSNSETISMVNSGVLPLTTDADSITVEIDALDIVKHNMAGPYTLYGIEISDADTGLTMADATDHTTTPYQLSEFEPLDSDGDGLSDALEQSIGTDPSKTDTDEDGVSDYDEVAFDGDDSAYLPGADTNPLAPDSDGDTMTDGYEIAYGLDPLIDDTPGDLDNDNLTNIQEYEIHTRPDKIDTDDDGRNDKWEVDNATNPIVYENYTVLAADINCDAAVGIFDLLIMASQWLDQPGTPSADIAPYNGDGTVNISDLAALAENWQIDLSGGN